MADLDILMSKTRPRLLSKDKYKDKYADHTDHFFIIQQQHLEEQGPATT